MYLCRRSIIVSHINKIWNTPWPCLYVSMMSIYLDIIVSQIKKMWNTPLFVCFFNANPWTYYFKMAWTKNFELLWYISRGAWNIQTTNESWIIQLTKLGFWTCILVRVTVMIYPWFIRPPPPPPGEPGKTLEFNSTPGKHGNSYISPGNPREIVEFNINKNKYWPMVHRRPKEYITGSIFLRPWACFPVCCALPVAIQVDLLRCASGSGWQPTLQVVGRDSW